MIEYIMELHPRVRCIMNHVAQISEYRHRYDDYNNTCHGCAGVTQSLVHAKVRIEADASSA